MDFASKVGYMSNKDVINESTPTDVTYNTYTVLPTEF